MATISDKSWTKYIVRLRNLSNKAADDLIKFINDGHDIYADPSMDKAVIDYAYGLATKYGEGAGALASEMYDALAELSGKTVPPAVPAPTAKYGEVAKAVYGTKLQSDKPEVMGGAVGRLVKMAGVDTMQQNALRDGAEWAWIPRGDTCAFCLTLASRGWQRASKKAIKNGHAEHIHANCDCTYAIRFSDDVTVEGYDPEALKAMYDEAEGATPNDKINYLRRRFYAENKGIVGAESSKAEEFIPQFSYIPGKTLSEVENTVREIVDDTLFGATGVSFKGVDLGIANETAEALTRFFHTYDVEKFGGIIAPAKNTRLGKMISNATAAYSPIGRSFLLNKDSLKSVKAAKKALEAEREAVKNVLEHPELYDFDRMSKRVRNIFEQSKVSGRGNVAESVTDVINHELGHSLEKKIKTLPNYEELKERMSLYAPKISGYATDDFSEYIAESFASFCKGENVADPEIIKAFKSFRRK